MLIALAQGAAFDVESQSGSPLQLATQMRCEPCRRLIDNYRARKSLFFATPPPAYVLQPIPLAPQWFAPPHQSLLTPLLPLAPALV